jgi:hypothetical protein
MRLRERPHTVAMTTKLFSSKCFFVLALATAGTSMAATKITYDEIPKHLGAFKTVLAYRGFTVTTTDGRTHSGRRLLLESDHLRIFDRDNSFEDLPNFDVTRIEIRQFGRFFHHVVENASFAAVIPLAAAVGGPALAIPAILLAPPFLAYAAASTPFFLAADGIAFLIPAKVYEIVH